MLADPPWSFRTFSAGGANRSAERHYDCMNFSEIEALPLRRVCDLDCWLFLWSTTAILPKALDVLAAWGFRYSGTAFVWAKTRVSGHHLNPTIKWHMGMGYTTRKNAELCLLGRRGRPAINAHDVRELIVAPVREHSRKPDEQYERIERLCDGPRLELFARHARKGWTSRGDQLWTGSMK